MDESQFVTNVFLKNEITKKSYTRVWAEYITACENAKQIAFCENNKNE